MFFEFLLSIVVKVLNQLRALIYAQVAQKFFMLILKMIFKLINVTENSRRTIFNLTSVSQQFLHIFFYSLLYAIYIKH